MLCTRPVRLTRLCRVVAWLSAQLVAMEITARLLACNVRPATSLCGSHRINSIGRVSGGFNHLVVNKDGKVMKIMKVCTGCQTLRNPDNGQHQKRGKVNRLICNICLQKTNKSLYSSKSKRGEK